MTEHADTLAVAAPAKRNVGTVVRVAVSALALALVFARIPFAEVVAAARGLDPAWAAAAVAAVYAAVVLSALKWRVLLRARGYSLGMARLTRHYLVGLFFNNFLPTSVGGDVVRAWEAGRDLDDAPEGAASVIAERLIASVALGVTAAAGLPFVGFDRRVVAAVVVVLAASALLVAFFLAPSRSERMMRGAMGGRFEGVSDWVARAVRGVSATLGRWRSVAVVLAMSVGFQVLVALVNYCLLRGLGVDIGLGACMVHTSVVSALTTVPASISGHGVREAGYAYFFGMAGVPAALAVLCSLLFFVVVAACTLPGGVLFALGRRR